MAETLQVILASPANFIGTLTLIFVTGVSLSIAFHPFGQIRTMLLMSKEVTDDGED